MLRLPTVDDLTTRSDAALVRAARAGDTAAGAALVDRHLATVRAVCHSRLRCDHDAADAVQDTFVRALSRLDQLEDPDRLAPWLRAIAARVCTDQGRRRSRTLPHPDPAGNDADLDPTPVELVLAAEEREVLQDHLDELGDRDRHALWMRDAMGAPVADVARELGVTEGSARVLLSRARRRLRTAYHVAPRVADAA